MLDVAPGRRDRDAFMSLGEDATAVFETARPVSITGRDAIFQGSNMIPTEVMTIAETLAYVYKGFKDEYEQYISTAWLVYEELQKK